MIHIQNLHKTLDGHAVLKGIDLEIPKGKITVIIGASGCGKTVLMRHIIGLMLPDRGRVVVDGTNMSALAGRAQTDFRRRFGMLFQNAALFDSLTVFENVAFPLRESLRQRVETVDVARIVREKLSLVGLQGSEHKMPDELSGGMRKRVGLARAIVLAPSIILYDEPTTGLDPLMTLAIDNLILSMQQELAVTSVVISHDIDSAMRLADLVAMVHDGRIIASGSPAQFQRLTDPIVRDFLEAGGRHLRGSAS